MIDVLIYESGNGGELKLTNGDIETTDGLFNMPYISHFGGNVEASTTGNEVEGEERNDWYGNVFLDTQAQMNSELERALNNNIINSHGRVNIENAAKKDLESFTDFAAVSSSVSIAGNDKITVSDKLNKTVVGLIWDATKSELIQEITI